MLSGQLLRLHINALMDSTLNICQLLRVTRERQPISCIQVFRATTTESWLRERIEHVEKFCPREHLEGLRKLESYLFPREFSESRLSAMLKASNGAGACFCSNNHSAQVTTAKCRARPNTKLDKAYFERKGARTWNVPEASVKELFEKTGINIAKEAIIKLGRFQFEDVKTELISLSKGGRLRKDHINQATHNLVRLLCSIILFTDALTREEGQD